MALIISVVHLNLTKIDVSIPTFSILKENFTTG